MLGPVYKYLLQISMTFGSNFKKKKGLVGLLIIFIAVGFIITMIQFKNSRMPYLGNQEFYFDKTKIYAEYYNSSTDNQAFLITPQIDSDIIDSKMMRLFIPIFSYELKELKTTCGNYEKEENKTEAEQKKEKRKWYLNCYSTYNQVFLNGEKISTDFMKYYFPESNQFGVISYINLENTKKGKNSITVTKKLGDNSNEWIIPFQYISND